MAESQPATESIRINELAKFVMWAKADPSQSRQSKLAWGERDGNPRITVFTNIPTDTQRNGIISAPMNPETFFGFMQSFANLVKGEPGRVARVLCYTSYGDAGGNGSAAGEKTLLSEIHYGKDEYGIVFLKLVAQGRPEIKFEFNVSDYHEIFKPDGTPLTKAEASQWIAGPTLETIRRIYEPITGGFRTNKPQSGGSSYQKPQLPNKAASDMFDDDVSF